MFHEGTIGIPVKDGKNKIAHYYIKTSDEPCEEGINGGRIVRLSIRIGGVWVAYFYKGWDLEPDLENEDVAIAYYICLKNYN